MTIALWFPRPGGLKPCAPQLISDLWDTNPHGVFGTPDERPDPAPGEYVDHSQEIRLKADRARLRLPAYVLIALGIAVVAVVVAIVAVLVGFT